MLLSIFPFVPRTLGSLDALDWLEEPEGRMRLRLVILAVFFKAMHSAHSVHTLACSKLELRQCVRMDVLQELVTEELILSLKCDRI